MAGKQLDARERRFVDEYLIDLDPKRAAIAAGYSASMAASKVYQWVSVGKEKRHVYGAIQIAMDGRKERTGITQDWVLQTTYDTVERCTGKISNGTLSDFNPGAVLKGAELAGRHLKMFTDKVELDAADPLKQLMLDIAGKTRGLPNAKKNK